MEKKYKYTGDRLVTFNVANADGSNRDVIMSTGLTTMLPADQEIVTDMVTKKMLVEVPEVDQDDNKNLKGNKK